MYIKPVKDREKIMKARADEMTIDQCASSWYRENAQLQVKKNSYKLKMVMTWLFTSASQIKSNKTFSASKKLKNLLIQPFFFFEKRLCNPPFFK
jgi:hypothetical protein